ncbi:hypothetical protein P167DRAFT_579723 [Morchella conica CCBAS932]|uniref:PiggyBac transposable element-derived protein domain-containing protein n=1 Tax=Morchella conica CCBAS932 TaxID=1392247 RepID=A0A3N4KMJ1_9PEZI|nr:hypothetical protein P167DRAFT_579723 [Morchella conica CCBAS932]
MNLWITSVAYSWQLFCTIAIDVQVLRQPFEDIDVNERVPKRGRTSTAARGQKRPKAARKPQTPRKPQAPRKPRAPKQLTSEEATVVESLPLPPEFDFFESPPPPHSAKPCLPSYMPADPSPLELFQLFFSVEILEEIVKNTNEYAEIKRGDTPGRPWFDLTVPELKMFIGVKIYMGVYRFLAIDDYWKEECKHPPMEKLSLNPYQQIKPFFHISPFKEELSKRD